ncbi:hypothetical protein KGF54_001708 [Candida jiufengensis]|uniref:uncharacterized protein n=1 Tax=Candida jiufengensis TaxID=497108 RepID=UPI0022244D41|nr:uncharacterized protein KGF54_001708 [Candida jiufengensis]KAI5955147.1 hypothetical protein KGF54_001708 [Candida jiufengensis]
MSSDEIKSYCNPELGPLPTKYTPPNKGILDLFSLKGKVASISGGSAGLGFAIAEGYCQAGSDVAIWYNSTPADDKAKYLEEKYGVKAKAYKADITNADDVKEVINEIKKDFGKIDIFVANAGIIWESGPLIDELDLSKWQKLIDVNVNAVFYCAHAIGQIFKQQGFGNLIITSSMSGSIVNIPQPLAAYNTSKAAVKHLAKSLAVEWAPFARVNSVSPGYISTKMVEYADKDLVGKWCQLTPLGRLANVSEIVGVYVYLASDAASYTTAADIAVDGGYTAV